MDDIALLLLWVAAVCGALIMASLVADMVGSIRKHFPLRKRPQATYRRK